MLGVIAGRDEKDPTASQEPVPNYLAGIDRGVRGLRIGVDAKWNQTGTDARMVRAVDEAIATVRALGGEIREVTFPDASAVIADWSAHCGIETAVAHEATYPSRKSEYGPALAGLIDLGRSQSGMDYQKILLRRLDFTGRLRALFESIDLLLISRTSLRIADYRRHGNARPGCWEDSDPASLHLSIRCQRQPNDYATVRFHRRWYAGCFPVRGSALPGGDAVPGRVCISRRDGLASPSSRADGLMPSGPREAMVMGNGQVTPSGTASGAIA